LPNINDINGVTVANLAKLDAVLKANISKVNGLTLAAAAAFLLDTYTGASAAYSTRKLKTGVTVAARIRRSGDDIEADVEFDSNNEISLTSPISNASSGTYTDLADFVDHSTTPRDAFVDEWKDQSGSGNHATQGTAANQPKLYDATTGLITENGKPALDFDGSNDYMPTSLVMGTLSAFTAFFVSAPDSNSVSSNLYDGRQGNDDGLRSIMFSDGNLFFSADADDLRSTAYTASQQLIYNNYASSNIYTAINGATADSTTAPASVGPTTNRQLVLFRDDIGSTFNFDGTAQEIVLWQSDQSSNRTGIESDINTYFSIY